MRLFVAAEPPQAVLDALSTLPRPDLPGVRWTPRATWHVTLRFLGEVGEASVASVREGLRGVAGTGPATAAVGPTLRRLGAGVWVAPVEGLADVAAAVLQATAGIVPLQAPDDTRPFAGHLTLARAVGRGRLPVPPATQLAPLRWAVDEVVLYRSHLGQPGGPRHEVLARVPLT